jgi:hypothetical protein
MTLSFGVLVLRRAGAVGTPPAAPASVMQVSPVTMIAPAQRQQINAVLSFRFTGTHRVTQLRMLSVKNVPTGSTVRITCTGKELPA